MAVSNRLRLVVGVVFAVVLVLFWVWRVFHDSPAYFFLLRLYKDPVFLRESLQAWGWLAPVVFIGIQALQVIFSPVPGEATGILGGYLFGLTLGFIYSTVGLTLGTVAAFWIGRWVGTPFVHRHLGGDLWQRLGFIVEAEGAVLAFVIYLVPGFPKDIVSYLFGLSPMPTWVFLVASTLGRMPGTWVLSAQGAKTAAGQYVQVALLTAAAAAAAVPLYYYRHRVLGWLRRTFEMRDRA